MLGLTSFASVGTGRDDCGVTLAVVSGFDATGAGTAAAEPAVGALETTPAVVALGGVTVAAEDGGLTDVAVGALDAGGAVDAVATVAGSGHRCP